MDKNILVDVANLKITNKEIYFYGDKLGDIELITKRGAKDNKFLFCYDSFSFMSVEFVSPFAESEFERVCHHLDGFYYGVPKIIHDLCHYSAIITIDGFACILLPLVTKRDGSRVHCVMAPHDDIPFGYLVEEPITIKNGIWDMLHNTVPYLCYPINTSNSIEVRLS